MSGSCVTTTSVIPFVAVQPLKDRHDLQADPRVQRAGGLVGEDDPRIVDERPRDGDALLLPAGELARLVIFAAREPDGAAAPAAPAPAARAADVSV